MTTEKKEFLTYSVYKRAAVNWIKSLPDHWEVRKAQYLFSRMQRQVKEEDEVITAFRDGRVTLRRLRREEGYTFAIKEIGYQGVRKGDLVISAMDAFAGAIGVSESAGKCSPVYSVCKAAPNVMPHFYGYMLQNMARTGFITSLSKGIRERSTDFRFAEFKVLELPVPPLAEQQAIVTFLDRETAHLDGLIERKNRLLELLEEQRRAVISQAVTRGLDPDTPLKDSGVPWLGQVPQHWEVMSIKRLASVKRGASPRPIDDPIYFDDEGEYGWVRISDVTSNGRYLDSTEQRLSKVGQEKSVQLEPGRIFISIAGSVGKVCITRIKCCIHDGFVYFDYFRQDPDYFYYLLALPNPYEGLGKMGTQLNLNTDTIGGIYVPVPSITEQQAIAAYLDIETAKLDVLRQKLEQSIAHLREYRAALITAAVTGQIDVREEATQA